MQKIIIGTFVGGLILFFWQFVSWQLANLHGSSMTYTPLEGQILECLSEAGLPEGEYFIPNRPPDMDPAEYMTLATEKYIGKPWAQIQYHHNFQNTMVMNLIRGFIIDLLAAFFVCIILAGNPSLNFRKILSTCLAVGMIGYLTIPYLNTIWFKTTSIPYLIDAIVPWALIGLVLGKILLSRGDTVSE